MCGEHCKPNHEWCRKDQFVSTCDTGDGTKIQSYDAELCGEYSFWRDVSCTTSIRAKKASTSDVYKYGLRCQGTDKHCSYPWYMSSLYSYEVKDFFFGSERRGNLKI